MANLQLSEYMKAQLKNGFKKEDLISAVRKAGWQESAIQEVLRELDAPVRKPIVLAPIVNPTPKPTPIQTVQKASPTPIIPSIAKPFVHAPIVLDMTGNATTTTPTNSAQSANNTKPISTASPASAPQTAPEIFGVQQMPQMRKPQKPVSPLPAFRPSEFAKPMGVSGYSEPVAPVITPTATVAPTQPKIVIPEVVVKAPEATIQPIAPVISTVSPVVPVVSRPVVMATTPISAPTIAPLPAVSQTVQKIIAPEAKVSFPRPSFIPQTSPAPLATPARPVAVPLKINPAFTPAARPSSMPPSSQMPAPITRQVPPIKPGFVPEAMPSIAPLPVAAAPVVHANLVSPTAPAVPFEGMRPGKFSVETQAPLRTNGVGILPQPRPTLIRQEPLQATPAPRKKHTGLVALLIIILILGAGGAFLYSQFPETIERAQKSVQALLPSNGPVPGSVLANSLTKLFATSGLKFKGNLTGSVVSAENPESNIKAEGKIEGEIGEFIPFPQSQNTLSLALTRIGDESPALLAEGELISSAEGTLYFKTNEISGTDNADGTYDALKEIWISIDGETTGLNKFAAIFGSQEFSAHRAEIQSILIRSQILAVASVFGDDPESGLHHYGLVIQKDKVLPAIIEIAAVMGLEVAENEKSAISNSISNASFPGIEVWINEETLTLNRVKVSATRGNAVKQSMSFDLTLLPLVGNLPEVSIPEDSIPLQEALDSGALPEPGAETI